MGMIHKKIQLNENQLYFFVSIESNDILRVLIFSSLQ